MTAKIPARVPYSAPKLGASYSASEIRQALGLLAQSVSPQSTRSVVAATTVKTTDDTILGNTTASNFAVTLPGANQVQYLKVSIKNTGTGTLTVTGTVDGSANPTLAQNKSMTIQSDGTAWWKLASV